MSFKKNVESNVFIYLVGAVTTAILSTITIFQAFVIPYVAGETKNRNRELEDSLQVTQAQIEELKSDTAFAGSEIREKLTSLRAKRRTIDTLQKKLSTARKNLNEDQPQVKKDSPVDTEVTQRLRSENSSLKSRVNSLEQKNSDLKSTIYSLQEENSDLRKDQKKANNVIESLRTQLCKSEREIRKLSGQDKYEDIFVSSSPYPSTAPQVRLGMNISKAQSMLEGYKTSLGTGILSVDMKEGAFKSVYYHHSGEGGDPQIDLITYNIRNETAVESLISQALCAFGFEPVNSEIQNTKFTWKDIKGHEVIITKNVTFHAGKYQVSKTEQNDF